MNPRLCAAFAAFATLASCLIPHLNAQAPKPWLDFPTDNRALITGAPDDFYMYVNRDFGGKRSKPWQGGQYGYVRGPRLQGTEVIYTSMHEGLDIKPLRRDAKGEPLDLVKAAADGTVVYVNSHPGASNYGRYVVVEHLIGGCPYYSLYAHLASTQVTAGQSVAQGTTLGVMGHSGVGLDRERSHLHFEFCMMLTREFDAWSRAFEPRDPNRHGNFNGRNLSGIDPSKLLRAARTTPASELPALISSETPCFKIRVPDSPTFDLLRLYPWLARGFAGPRPPAWTITFSRHLVPLKIEPYSVPIQEAQLAGIQRSKISYSHLTRGVVTGPAENPRLSDSGRQFAQRLTFPN